MRCTFLATFFLAFVPLASSFPRGEPRTEESSVESLIGQLRDKDPDKVCGAARALGLRGPAAKAAVAALKETLKDRNGRVRLAAAEALWRLQHQARDLVPAYAELLTAADADVRAASAWRLGRLGSDARPAVPVLAAALRDENYEVRVQAGQALANLGLHAEAALPALVRALGDGRLDAPSQARGKPESAQTSPALPALVEMADLSIPLLIATFHVVDRKNTPNVADEPSPYEARYRAAHVFPAFGALGVAPLVLALESKDKDTRWLAAFALREIAAVNGGLPETAVVALEKCLDNSDKDLRAHAARAMALVRPSSAKAVAILESSQRSGHIDNAALLADLNRMSSQNPAAIKLLRRMCEDKDAETSREAYRLLGRLALPAYQMLKTWTAALSHPNKEVRSEAIQALRAYGPAARPALAALRELFAHEDDAHNKGNILTTLAAIDADDPGLTPLLIKSTDNQESWIRTSVATLLKSLNAKLTVNVIYADEPGLISLLYKSIEEREFWARTTAVWTLKELGPKAREALPVLEAQLFKVETKGDADIWRDSYVKDRVDALIALSPGSPRLVAVLLKALRNEFIRDTHDPRNTWYMRTVLEDGLQTGLPAAVPALREALTDKDPLVRQSVALVLVGAGLEVETALPVLMREMWNDDDRSGEANRFQGRVVELLMRRRTSTSSAVAAALCKAWRTAGPNAREVLERGLLVLQPEALPHLLDQLKQAETPRARRDRAHLLVRFEGQGKNVVPILRDELRQPKFADQFLAMQALMAIGPDGAEAVPELLRLLRDSRPGVQAVAAKTLGRIGRAARPAVPKLKEMLKDANSTIRVVAADALSRIDADATEALKVLCDEWAVRSGDGAFFYIDNIELPEGVSLHENLSDSIDEAILRFGERAVVVLADMLDNADLDEWSADNLSAQCGSPVRIQAALLLARLGPEAKASVPALIRALSDKDSFVRDAAASALGRIGPAAKDAAPDVIALLEKQNRLASAAGPWGSGGSGPATYARPFDFRDLGREHVRSRSIDFGYGYSKPDPFRGIRAEHPHDPAYVLSRIDAQARSALPLLSEMAKDPAHPGRLAAALAMWRSGNESPELIPAFSDALQAHASGLRTHARISRRDGNPLSREVHECLAELGVELKPAIPALADWLTLPPGDVDRNDRVAVATALGRCGADARTVSDSLRNMIDRYPWNARASVAIALALFRIAGEKERAFPFLRALLAGQEDRWATYYEDGPTANARVQAARALGVLAEHGDERARALIVEAARGDENPHVCVAALEVTGRLKQTGAIAGLSALLRHPDAEVRIAAVSALGRLGPQAKSSRPALKTATEDAVLGVRQAASQALESLD